MPELTPGEEHASQPAVNESSQAGTSETAGTSQSLDELRAERDRIREELDEYKQASLTDWMVIAHTENRILGDMQNTISWKVTKPLRAARRFQLMAAERGLGEASRAGLTYVSRRLSRKR